MKGNDDKRQHVIPFMKCFTGLVGAFTPEEVIFMLYMADRTRLRDRMNASYRLNTCKSRGCIIKACLDGWRPAHG